ncbi:MAG TPA: hypothetical protein VK589_12860 [Chryseolinea sp.]|nr:hypothetical protein [Chryseolinea sp.]
MKKTIFTLTALTLFLSAFTTNNSMVTEKKKRATTSEQMAERIVSALQHASAKEYASMFPSLEDFNDMMKESSEIYGTYLADAQREFANSYEHKLIPTVEHAFELLIDEGRSKGIEWNNIRYIGTEQEEQPKHRFSPIPVTIVFSSNGVEHRIYVERALVINGQWNVSQFIKLI